MTNPFVNKRNFHLARSYGPGAVVFGVAGALAFLFVSDWKVTNPYIPFYGSSPRFIVPEDAKKE